VVRILRLGTSDDTNPVIPIEQRTVATCERAFTEATGLPAETIVRRIVPSADAGAVVERWMARFEPDCVVLIVSSFWMAYETSVFRLGNALPGPLQPLVGGARYLGSKTATNQSAPVRAARRMVRRGVGVASRNTPAEVAAAASDCIRQVLRQEDVTLIVRSPVTRYPGDGRPSTRARLEARRLAVDDELAALCRRLHVDYLRREPNGPETDDHLLLPDGVHAIASENVRRGEREGFALAAAWLRTHALQPR
jgi:hypothetical protein